MNGLMALRILEKMDPEELKVCSVRLFDSGWLKEMVGDWQMGLEEDDERIDRTDKVLESLDDVELASIAGAAADGDGAFNEYGAYLDKVEAGVIEELLERARETESKN